MIFIVAFIGAITPGPDILLIIQTTLRYGFKKALITLFGIASGWIFYLAILYLSFILYKKPSNDLEFRDSRVIGGYKKGLLVNLSNPKAILFFSVVVLPYMDNNMIFNLMLLFFGLFSAFLFVVLIASYFRRFVTNKLFNIIDKICAFIFLVFVVILIVKLFRDLL